MKSTHYRTTYTLYSSAWTVNVLSMKNLIVSLVFLLTATAVVAQQMPSCPDRGSDPGSFCLPGTTYDEISKACVVMA